MPLIEYVLDTTPINGGVRYFDVVAAAFRAAPGGQNERAAPSTAPTPTSVATTITTGGAAGNFLLHPLADNPTGVGSLPTVGAAPGGQGWRDEDFYSPNQNIASVVFTSANWRFFYSLAYDVGLPSAGTITVIAYAIDATNAARELFRHTSGTFVLVSGGEANYLDVFNPGAITLNPNEIVQYEFWWTVVSGTDPTAKVHFRAGAGSSPLVIPSITAAPVTIVATGPVVATGGGAGAMTDTRASSDLIRAVGGGAGLTTGARISRDVVRATGGGSALVAGVRSVNDVTTGTGGGSGPNLGRKIEGGVAVGDGGGAGLVVGSKSQASGFAIGSGGGEPVIIGAGFRSNIVGGHGGGGVFQTGGIATRRAVVAAGGGGRATLTGTTSRFSCATPAGLAALLPAVIEALLTLLGLSDPSQLLCTVVGAGNLYSGGGGAFVAGVKSITSSVLEGEGGGSGTWAGSRTATSVVVGTGGGDRVSVLSFSQAQGTVLGHGGGGGFCSGTRTGSGLVQGHGGGDGPNVGVRIVGISVLGHGGGGCANSSRSGHVGFCLAHGAGAQRVLAGYSSRTVSRHLEGGGRCPVTGTTTLHFGTVFYRGGGTSVLGEGRINLVEAACLEIAVASHTRVKLCVRSATDVGTAVEPSPVAEVCVKVRCRS